jgi:large subunit ribosomal protein L3
MTIGIRGKKIGMTRFFDNNGKCIPVTIVKVFTGNITNIKLKKTHGYSCIQTISKISIKNSLLTEYHILNTNIFKIGDILNLNIFSLKEKIFVKAKTIGKGNIGNIKRNNFKRGPMSHGSKHHRLQGSLGAGTTPSRVFPGKKMAGRLGFKNKTIKNLQILHIDYSNNFIFINGSIPGKFNNIINILKNYEIFST